MSLFDWIFTDTSKTQTIDEANANYKRLQDDLVAQGKPLGANAGTLQDPGSAAADSFWKALTFQSDPNDPNPSAGIGSVIMDVLVIAVVGAGIWAFFKFGGTGLLKTLAKKNKWYAAGIVGGAILLLWFIYSQFKKTASDTASTVSGVADGLEALNPFN
jgi:hypothetical protein